MASGIHAARSRLRASCSNSAALRPTAGAGGATRAEPGTATAVTTRSPCDHVIGEVIDLTGDVLAEQVIERQQIRDDVEIVIRIRDALWQQLAEQTAVRVAHREGGGRQEPQTLGLELD